MPAGNASPPGLRLAASVIVRDEEANLRVLLPSLVGVVDEIHIHDTGSTDATVQVAASFGAVVTTGPWTDDFAAARNEALQGWTADWVLVVDADQTVIAHPTALRRLLATTTADVLHASIDNEQEGTVYRNTGIAAFRPDAARWQGRVHEKLVGRRGPLRVDDVPPDVLRFEHRGYAEDDVRRAKAERNATLARAVLHDLSAAGDDADHALAAKTMLDLGRSLVSAGHAQDAVHSFEAVRELFPGTAEWREATDFLARLVLGQGMEDVCLALVAQLRDAGAEPTYCDWLEAQAVAQQGDFLAARRLLAGVTDVVDTAGRQQDPARLHELKDLVDRLAATL